MRGPIHIHIHRALDSSPDPRYADLADRMAAALEELMGWAKASDAEWREEDHPRAPDGRFGTVAGELGPKPTTVKGKSAKARIHELLSSGHSFTKQELMAACGIESEKLFSDYIAMLKNPKYAGSGGALQIVRGADGSYSVAKRDGIVTNPPRPTPAPTPAPTQAPAPPPSSEEEHPASAPAKLKRLALRVRELGDIARAYSNAAKTPDGHRQAAIVHREAAEAARQGEALAQGLGDESARISMSVQRQYHEGRAKTHETDEANLRAREQARNSLPPEYVAETRRIESRFLKTPPEEIDRQFRTRFGMGVDHAGRGASLVRGAKGIDLSATGAAATNQRKIIGHVWNALEDLEKKGYDVRGALAAAPKPIEYCPATLSRANGLAWGMSSAYFSKGFFAVSGSKRLGTNEAQYASNRQRLASGQPRWTVSAGALGAEAARATIVHELTHALGMQKGIESPARLREALGEITKDAPAAPGEKHPEYGGEHRARLHWIKTNISEYAAANINETDAELAAMVTSDDYKPGTLPKVLEDHIARLFKRRAK